MLFFLKRVRSKGLPISENLHVKEEAFPAIAEMYAEELGRFHISKYEAFEWFSKNTESKFPSFKKFRKELIKR